MLITGGCCRPVTMHATSCLLRLFFLSKRRAHSPPVHTEARRGGPVSESRGSASASGAADGSRVSEQYSTVANVGEETVFRMSSGQDRVSLMLGPCWCSEEKDCRPYRGRAAVAVVQSRRRLSSSLLSWRNRPCGPSPSPPLQPPYVAAAEGSRAWTAAAAGEFIEGREWQ